MTVVEVSGHPQLFDPDAVVATCRRTTPEEGFRRFLARNLGFMRRLAEMAYEARARGQRFSTKAAWESLRTEYQGGLNNNWTSVAARRLVDLYPDLDGVVELRGKK